jgi:UDP-N-acetylglucosamine 4,6-dehydratase/5-epimerase
MSALAGSTVLVTGGTGSFGQTIVRQLLDASAAQIRILSRDEAKQDLMRERFADDRLVFITGDVRDASTVVTAMQGARHVFHAAALKQVPNCERHPMEAIRTNTLGSENVRLAALQCLPESVVGISTDKACSPINTMGLCKALMERLLLQETTSSVRFVCVRYGNVIGSRGSVVPLFADRVRRGLPIPITDPTMTRFLLSLPEAVATALDASTHGKQGELWVRKMPAATVSDLAEAMAPGHPIDIVGVRPGEKLHEVLVNEDEMRRAYGFGDHFVIGTKPGASRRPSEYTSANTTRLSVDELRSVLRDAEALS